MRVLLIFTLLLLVNLCAAIAQDQKPAPSDTLVLPDSLRASAADSGMVMEKHRNAIGRFFSKGYPNPHLATIFGIIPGGGQMYNKKWWKLPIVYGALGGMLWWQQNNLKEYRILKYNYRLLVDGDPKTNPTESPYNRIDAASMKVYRDQFYKYTELTTLGLGLTYLLSITDAFVDAHLSRFDTNDDLGFRFEPGIQDAVGFGPSLGLSLKIRLDGKQAAKPAHLFNPVNP
ncbi:MAG: DUF5683 domain-containing protein [Bacteroidota bacterium]